VRQLEGQRGVMDERASAAEQRCLALQIQLRDCQCANYSDMRATYERA
jgi:hypothetical protein